MIIKFVLTGEGSSDLNLVHHIENILVESGFKEVSGEIFEPARLPYRVGHSVTDKLSAIKSLYPTVDFVFVHRDADAAGTEARRKEIAQAASSSNPRFLVIPMVPKSMLETWLLCDLESIKRVAGNPKCGSDIVDLPPVSRLEQVRDSKDLLEQALCRASQLSGARLKKFRKQFGQMRARLALELDHSGDVNSLISYREFRRELDFHCRAHISP